MKKIKKIYTEIMYSKKSFGVFFLRKVSFIISKNDMVLCMVSCLCIGKIFEMPRASVLLPLVKSSVI